MEDRSKLFILTSKREVLLLHPLLLKILEEKLVNGISGIHILISSRGNKSKNKKMTKIKRINSNLYHLKKLKVEDIQLLLKDV